jgi:hypothetical protein
MTGRLTITAIGFLDRATSDALSRAVIAAPLECELKAFAETA